MRFETRDGAVLHADEHGVPDGPPVVVVPGGPGRHPRYLGTFEPVTATRRVIVVHPRGVGGSKDAPARSFAEQADDLEDLRLHLGVEALDLIAHATGCRTAVLHALRAPERVEHLLLVSPATAWLGIPDDDRLEIAHRRRDESWFEQAIDAAVRLHDELDADRRLTLYRRAAPLGWARWNDRARSHENDAIWYPEALDGFFVPLDGSALRDELRRITCPVVVVGGEDDALVGFRPLETLADCFPRGSLAAIESCGHFPWVEAPAEFAIALRAFLADAPAAPPLGRRRPRTPPA